MAARTRGAGCDVTREAWCTRVKELSGSTAGNPIRFDETYRFSDKESGQFYGTARVTMAEDGSGLLCAMVTSRGFPPALANGFQRALERRLSECGCGDSLLLAVGLLVDQERN